MENYLNTYQKNQKYESAENPHQSLTYGEYRKQKKLDEDKAISSTSEMQDFLNANITRRTKQNPSREKKFQQPKNYEEYLRSKQTATKMEASNSKSFIDATKQNIKPNMPRAKHRLDVPKQGTSYGECRKGKQNSLVSDILHKTQDYSTRLTTNIAMRTMQNYPEEMEVERLEGSHSTLMQNKQSTYGEYLRSKNLTQGQTDCLKDNSSYAYLAEEKQEQSFSYEEYENRKQLEISSSKTDSNARTIDANRTTQNNSRITGVSQELQRHEINVESLKNNSTTGNTNNSNEIRRKEKREIRKRIHFKSDINRLGKLNQNSLTEDQKRELHYAKTIIEESNAGNVRKAALQPKQQNEKYFKRTVVDKSSDDWSISRDNWQRVETKLVDVFFKIVIEGTATVPAVRDAGWYQGIYKLMYFGDRSSIRFYRVALAQLGDLWPGADLCLVCIHELPARPAAVGYIPAKPTNHAAALQLLRDSNPRLPTDDWIMRKFGKAEDHRRKIVILINTKSLPQLEESASVISYGFGQVDLKIYRQEHDLWRTENIKPDVLTDSSFELDFNNELDEYMEYNSNDGEEGSKELTSI